MPGIFSTQILNLRLLPRLPHGRPALRPWATRGPYQWILPEVGPRWAQTLPLGWGVTNFKVNTKSLEYLICQTCRFQSKKLLFTQLPRHGIIYYTMKANVQGFKNLLLANCDQHPLNLPCPCAPQATRMWMWHSRNTLKGRDVSGMDRNLVSQRQKTTLRTPVSSALRKHRRYFRWLTASASNNILGYIF